MAKLTWDSNGEEFEARVQKIIRETLQPLNHQCSKQEDVLVLCVAYLTATVKLMRNFGYDKQEIESRVLGTMDLVWLATELTQRGEHDTVH